MIPVVFIHMGNPSYLNFAIKQALKRNEVCLISDIKPDITSSRFQWVDIKDCMSDRYKLFQQAYVHMSTNPYDFELFCFLRWFVVHEYMKNTKNDVVFYTDSDVFLYVDVNDEFPKYAQYDLTLLHRCAPVSSFVTNKGIVNFTNFLLTTYQNQQSYNFEKIASHFVVRQKHNLSGGVCDMTLFEHFHYSSDVGGGPGKVGEMMSILNDSTYDHNINAEDQYFNFNRIKQIEFVDGIPYVYSNKLNKPIKFNSIHFNSGAKSMMQEYYAKSAT